MVARSCPLHWGMQFPSCWGCGEWQLETPFEESLVEEPPHQMLSLKHPHSMQVLKSLPLEPTGDHSAGPSQLQSAPRDQMRPLLSPHDSPATPLDQLCSLPSSVSCSEKLIPQSTSFMLISTSEPASQGTSSKTEFKLQGYLFAIPHPVFQVSCNTWLNGFACV